MSDNSKSYLSLASLTCVLLIPLWIGLASSDKIQGGLRGIVAISILFGLPYIAFKTTSCKHKNKSECKFDAPFNYSITFSVTFVIVVIAMLVTNT